MPDSPKILVPIDWLPAGLLTWYTSDRRVYALATPWIALVCRDGAYLRAACPDRQAEGTGFRPESDFVLNIPGDQCLPLIRRFVIEGTYCIDVAADLDQEVCAGIEVDAPRLAGCLVQLECRGGRLVETGFDPEICGEIVLVHRDRKILTPTEMPNLCASDLLSPAPPAARLH